MLFPYLDVLISCITNCSCCLTTISLKLSRYQNLHTCKYSSRFGTGATITKTVLIPQSILGLIQLSFSVAASDSRAEFTTSMFMYYLVSFYYPIYHSNSALFPFFILFFLFVYLVSLKP